MIAFLFVWSVVTLLVWAVLSAVTGYDLSFWVVALGAGLMLDGARRLWLR